MTHSEKSVEKTEKDKEALAAMKNAKNHMQIAISRIEQLESALKSARDNIRHIKEYIAPNTYCYDGKQSCRSKVDEVVTGITKALGD